MSVTLVQGMPGPQETPGLRQARGGLTKAASQDFTQDMLNEVRRGKKEVAGRSEEFRRIKDALRKLGDEERAHKHKQKQILAEHKGHDPKLKEFELRRRELSMQRETVARLLRDANADLTFAKGKTPAGLTGDTRAQSPAYFRSRRSVSLSSSPVRG